MDVPPSLELVPRAVLKCSKLARCPNRRLSLPFPIRASEETLLLSSVFFLKQFFPHDFIRDHTKVLRR